MQPLNVAKKDFFELSGNVYEQYSGSNDGPIISAVKRRFFKAFRGISNVSKLGSFLMKVSYVHGAELCFISIINSNIHP